MKKQIQANSNLHIAHKLKPTIVSFRGNKFLIVPLKISIEETGCCLRTLCHEPTVGMPQKRTMPGHDSPAHSYRPVAFSRVRAPLRFMDIPTKSGLPNHRPQGLYPPNTLAPSLTALPSIFASLESLGAQASISVPSHARTVRYFVCFLARTVVKAVWASLWWS